MPHNPFDNDLFLPVLGVVVLGVLLRPGRDVDHLHAEGLHAEFGAGAGNGSPRVMFCGRNVPSTQGIGAVPIGAVAWSSSVMSASWEVGAWALVGASLSTTAPCPCGPTSKMSTSRVNVCVRPCSVRLTSVTPLDSPLTWICDG